MRSWLNCHRPGHATVVAYLALFVALGGGAVAATSIVGGDGQIHGCYDKRGANKGTLRVVAEGAPCKRGERAIAWNQRGRQGAPGQPGATGQTGPPGPATGPAGGALAGSYPNPALAPAEDWHEVPSFGTCSLSPSANWENYGITLATVAYYRDPFGVVRLKGSLKCEGTSGVSYTFFTLPPGYRPPAVQYFPAGRNFGTATTGVSISPFGGVAPQNSVPAGETVSLDTVSFRCAPSGVDGCP